MRIVADWVQVLHDVSVRPGEHGKTFRFLKDLISRFVQSL